jgi:hypothetical protein
MALGDVQRFDKSWEIHAVVLEKRSGVSESSGEQWYAVKIGGYTFFDFELYKRVEEGDRVILKGIYTGDRYNRRSQSYSPQHDLEDVVVVEGAFVDARTKVPALNGNGKFEKGQPA